MIGAGTFISPVLRIVTVVAIVGAIRKANGNVDKIRRCNR
jgi:hypothetical protein